MNRVLVMVLICSFGQASVAFAGDTLLESARRAARQAETMPTSPQLANGTHVNRVPSGATLRRAQGTPGLATSGMKKRSKLLIGLMVAAGFVGVVYAIDHGVEDSTPSSRGER